MSYCLLGFHLSILPGEFIYYYFIIITIILAVPAGMQDIGFPSTG